MKKLVLLSFLVFLFFDAHSQKTKRWKINDSTYVEIQSDAEPYKPKGEYDHDSIQFFFLANFFNDTIKITIEKDTLVDTVLSTRKEVIENGVKQVELSWFSYLPKVEIKRNDASYIYYLINKVRIRFPFKKKYSFAYFRYYPEHDENGRHQRVYSLEYTNKYLKRL